MPWSRTNPSKERVKFALEWEKRWDAGEGRMNLAELCREFGVSRETGPSPHRYPRKLVEFEYPHAHRVERVDKQGCVRWANRRVLITAALAHEYVSIDQDAGQDDDNRWTVRWGELTLGWLDERRLDRGLIEPPRRRR